MLENCTVCDYSFKVLPDDDTLVLTVDHHISVHVICQSVDVRRVLILSLREPNHNEIISEISDLNC